jgi:hypothetical protein
MKTFDELMAVLEAKHPAIVAGMRATVKQAGGFESMPVELRKRYRKELLNVATNLMAFELSLDEYTEFLTRGMERGSTAENSNG